MQDGSRQIPDGVPHDAPCNTEIGFAVPDRYNASAILFDNLIAGSHRPAVIGPGGSRTYGELAADAVAFGAGLLSLGLQRGDRVLLFLDDTPAYPAAVFGAIRAGLVPLLINTLTPPDLLQFYLSDSGATVAICDAAFVDRFNAEACRATDLQDRGGRERRRHSVRPGAQHNRADEWLAQPDRSAASGRHPSRRHGVLDVLVRIDRPPEGHRASAARHALHAPVVRAPPARNSRPTTSASRCRRSSSPTASATRSRSPSASAPPASCCPASPSPPPSSTASRAIAPRSSSACRRSTPRSPKPPEAAGRRPVEPAPRRVRRRGPLGRRVQRLEGDVRPRDHGGARLQRGAAHLPVEHGRKPRSWAPPASACRATRSAWKTAKGGRWPTARKASCGCAAIPMRPSTGTVPTRPPRPCARAAGSTPATASCATPTASTSSAAAPTIWSRSAANGSTRSRSSSPSPIIRSVRECAVARHRRRRPAHRSARHSSSSTTARARSDQTTKVLQDLRQGAPAALQIPAHRRLPRRAAQDRLRQDRPPGPAQAGQQPDEWPPKQSARCPRAWPPPRARRGSAPARRAPPPSAPPRCGRRSRAMPPPSSCPARPGGAR